MRESHWLLADSAVSSLQLSSRVEVILFAFLDEGMIVQFNPLLYELASTAPLTALEVGYALRPLQLVQPGIETVAEDLTKQLYAWCFAPRLRDPVIAVILLGLWRSNRGGISAGLYEFLTGGLTP